jgi:hypothetical protein
MFEPNLGQSDGRVQFLARGTGYGLFLTKKEAVLSLLSRKSASDKTLSRSVVRMSLVGANPDLSARGSDPLPGKSNYFIGNDAKKWRRDVPQYTRVRYADVYPGVDLVYYGNQGQLEYDFEVAPGADPKTVRLKFDGAQKLALEGQDLVLTTGNGTVRLQAPRIYQKDGGSRSAVDGRFVLLADNTVGFEVGAYDRNRGLVIDPTLLYLSYLGGTGVESFPTIAVDSAFNFYVAGATTSTDFPVTTTPAALQAHLKGAMNAFVAKFNSNGAAPLVFATYLGGSQSDTVQAVAVDAGFNVYLAGTTTSPDFPTNGSVGPLQATPVAPGTHAFVTKLAIAQDGTQTLQYSTYLSGSGIDTMSGLTLDNGGLVYVIGTTTSNNFPTAPQAGAFQTSLLGPSAFFISKIDPKQTGAAGLLYSTYFGGSFPTTGTVTGGGIAVDNNSAGSNIYITGGTNFQFNGGTNDFPIKNAFQACLNSPKNTCNEANTNLDAFIAKLNPQNTAGAQLVYSTYLGGSNNDVGTGIGVDSAGNAYISGWTNSPDFLLPGATAAHQTCLNPVGGVCQTPPDTTHTDAFVGKVTNPAAGSSNTNVFLSYFSYLGGSGDDAANGIAVDAVQGARITGVTNSSDLQTVPKPGAIQPSLGGGKDAFVARLYTAATGGSTSGLGEFVTYLGGAKDDRGTGIAVDSNAATYVAGETASPTLPSGQLPPFQGSLTGAQNAFVAKLSPTVSLKLQAPPPVSSVNAGNNATFTYTITNQGDTVAGVAFIDNLANPGVTATFVSASASGGTCPTTATNNTVICNVGVLNGGATATVTVTLTPTGPGILGNSGTVIVAGSSFTSSASTSVTVNSYTLSVQPPSVTVAAGNTATYTATVTPQGNYTASISLSCPSGLPSGTGSGCTFSTNPITLSGSSPSSVQISITTTARTSTTAALRHTGPYYALFLPIGGLTLFGLGLGGKYTKRRRLIGLLMVLLLVGLVAMQPACSHSSSTTVNAGTPAGTYAVTMSATSGSFSQSNQMTLVVQ